MPIVMPRCFTVHLLRSIDDECWFGAWLSRRGTVVISFAPLLVQIVSGLSIVELSIALISTSTICFWRLVLLAVEMMTMSSSKSVLLRATLRVDCGGMNQTRDRRFVVSLPSILGQFLS